MVDYYKSNSDALAEVTEQLKSQSQRLQDGEQQAFADDSETGFVYLRKKEIKRWLIYHDYELKVKRYMIPVRTNYNGAKILVDGNESATATGDESSIELGPFLPGEYVIEAVYEGDYTTLKKKRTVSLFPKRSYEDTVELMLEGDYVHVYSNNPKARIYIDGKDIGLIVEDGQRIGPIAIDGSNKMVLEAEYPWGTLKSEELPIDADRLEIKIDGLNDMVKEDIMNAAHDFLSSSIQSLQAMDASLLQRTHPDRLADQANYIEAMKANAQKYSGKLNRMTFDLNSFVLIPLEDGGYSAQVKAQIDYSEITYYEEDTPPDPIDGTLYTDYELVYENGQWIVSTWFQANDIGTENTKVYE